MLSLFGKFHGSKAYKFVLRFLFEGFLKVVQSSTSMSGFDFPLS